MILFAAGRGEALKRFLVEDGAGQDQRFWRLAQALSALTLPKPKKSAGLMASSRGRKAWVLSCDSCRDGYECAGGGIRSAEGASFEILQALRRGEWRCILSNHLVTECEEKLLDRRRLCE